jgi:signal transduction histidine kinase
MIVFTEEVGECLRQVAEAFDHALLLVDRDGVLHVANRAARDLLDLPPDRATLSEDGGPWPRLVLDLVRRLVTEGSAAEVHLATPQAFVLEGFAVRRAEAPWGGLVVARGSAGRGARGNGREQAEFAHEVKNALHSLLLNVYILRRWALAQPQADTEMLGRCDSLSTEMQRLNALAETFLPLAGGMRVRGEPLQLLTLLTDVVRQLTREAEHRGVTIAFRVPTELPAIRGDGRLLRDAFVALLRDRLQQLPPGRELELIAGAGAEHAFIMVRDGAPAHPRGPADAAAPDLARGPAIVDWVARGHGGSLETFSAGGLGTTFFVKLPLWTAAPDAVPQSVNDAS